jgi:hypothetical protein
MQCTFSGLIKLSASRNIIWLEMDCISVIDVQRRKTGSEINFKYEMQGFFFWAPQTLCVKQQQWKHPFLIEYKHDGVKRGINMNYLQSH